MGDFCCYLRLRADRQVPDRAYSPECQEGRRSRSSGSPGPLPQERYPHGGPGPVGPGLPKIVPRAESVGPGRHCVLGTRGPVVGGWSSG
jgi:hypothetical protein